MDAEQLSWVPEIDRLLDRLDTIVFEALPCGYEIEIHCCNESGGFLLLWAKKGDELIGSADTFLEVFDLINQEERRWQTEKPAVTTPAPQAGDSAEGVG